MSRYHMKSALTDILWTVLFAVLAFFALRASIQTFIVGQTSMLPNVQPGWWVMVDKLSYRFTEPRRGDIIIFKPPYEVGQGGDFIKRLIAVPGDTVEVRGLKVYINGVPLTEPYLVNVPHYTMSARTIPEDEYFVLGDNRDTSTDSHYGWLVPRDDIVGRGWIIMWPPSQWGRAPNHNLDNQVSSATSLGGLSAPALSGMGMRPWP